jgi:hypothetical protein
MLVGVVLAVPVRSALERKAPRWCEIRAVGVTVVGLAVFILSASSGTSGGSPRMSAAGCFVLGCFAAAFCALRASRRAGSPSRQATRLGFGAGVMFGATAGLLKIVAIVVTDRSHFLTLGVVVALVAAGLLGTAMNQRAYQIAPLSYSMPVVNVVDIMVAVLFGAVVLGELPGHSATRVALQLAALGCVTVGLRLLSALQTAGADSGPGSGADPRTSATVGHGQGSAGAAELSGSLSGVDIRRAVSGAGVAACATSGGGVRSSTDSRGRGRARSREDVALADVHSRSGGKLLAGGVR